MAGEYDFLEEIADTPEPSKQTDAPTDGYSFLDEEADRPEEKAPSKSEWERIKENPKEALMAANLLGVNSLTGGFLDEAVSYPRAALDKLAGDERSFDEVRKAHTKAYRNRDDSYREKYPTTGKISEIMSKLPQMLLPGGASTAVGLGALDGAGYSEAQDMSGVAQDALVSGGITAGTLGAIKAAPYMIPGAKAAAGKVMQVPNNLKYKLGETIGASKLMKGFHPNAAKEAGDFAPKVFREGVESKIVDANRGLPVVDTATMFSSKLTGPAGKIGEMLEESGRAGLSKLAKKKALREADELFLDPRVASVLANQSGTVGDKARKVLEGFNSGGAHGAKANLFSLAFERLVDPSTDEEDLITPAVQP